MICWAVLVLMTAALSVVVWHYSFSGDDDNDRR